MRLFLQEKIYMAPANSQCFRLSPQRNALNFVNILKVVWVINIHGARHNATTALCLFMTIIFQDHCVLKLIWRTKGHVEKKTLVFNLHFAWGWLHCLRALERRKICPSCELWMPGLSTGKLKFSITEKKNVWQVSSQVVSVALISGTAVHVTLCRGVCAYHTPIPKHTK